MERYRDIILVYNEEKAKRFIKRIEGKNPLFICVIGTTETAKIPGISAAGKNPELTDYTPAADAELLLLERVMCTNNIPVTPEGIPTPALITRSALRLADIPVLVVSGGTRVKPKAPYINLGGEHGGDIRTGVGVKNPREILERARVLGQNLAKIAKYLVIGESIPGGTTTALGIMLAMGIDARLKVSSSMPDNPHDLKIRVVEEGMNASRISFGNLANDPIKAISYLGDPMMPALAGIAMAAASKVPVLLAGGTQMAAILVILKALDSSVLDNIAIGTTRWIISDNSSDLKGLITQIADVPIMAADLDFSRSRFDGLKVYEEGAVKEGVGAGGASISAILKSRGSITKEALLNEVEEIYEKIVQGGW